MEVYVFKMDDGQEYSVLARSLAEAHKRFDPDNLDEREVLEVRKYTSVVCEAQVD